jgi:Protein of unknown function (DUF2865)
MQRASRILLATLTLTAALTVHHASAQSPLQGLFGGFERGDPPPQASRYADPQSLGNDTPRSTGQASAPSTTYCVRICDGRFFPVQQHAGVSYAEACKSFCPAAKTMLFSGSTIDRAVSVNGTRYTDLEHAFAFRNKIVDNCTCNGKDGFGVARLRLNADPTLRPGDIVALNEGLATYKGKSAKAAKFTPIKPTAGEIGRRLSMTKVTRQPEPETVLPIADDPAPPKTRNRTTQYAR